jgi:asparagine synthase (glutamine-hydrolysing)
LSVIFGMRLHNSEMLSEPQLRALAPATERYAPDGTAFVTAGSVGMGFQGFYTNRRSRMETGAVRDSCGNLITFDGRLDNYSELCGLLEHAPTETADSSIVLAAFQKWGEDCFSRFIGDWALALWSVRDRSLYLARDHAGTRTLYFEISEGTVVWSTYLETLLVHQQHQQLDEAFIACYLVCEPLRDLTPYKGVQAVTPAHYVVVNEEGSVVKEPHWRWMAKGRILYKNDEEYEEHFRKLFRQAVERRTDSDSPVLAQLSGGMDSTSIVCMSDLIRRERGASPAELIDTVSYYDDSEPNWDEKPYFTLVEAQRGKRGIHIQTPEPARSLGVSPAPYPMPGADNRTALAEEEFEQLIGRGTYRVIVSGLGGDELLGGPPNPLPELADCLVRLQLQRLLRQSFRWCTAKREPLLQMLSQTAGFLAATYPRIPRAEKMTPEWASETLRARYRALKGSEHRPITLGLRPTAIDNGIVWWNMLETLPHRFHSYSVRYEYRYPYLDRDLVDFLLHIPAEQLLRPGRRRYLMRNALRQVVPTEILERKRKASVFRGPLQLIPQNRDALRSVFAEPLSEASRYIDGGLFRVALEQADAGTISEWFAPMMRAIYLELWLRAQGTRVRAA